MSLEKSISELLQRRGMDASTASTCAKFAVQHHFDSPDAVAGLFSMTDAIVLSRVAAAPENGAHKIAIGDMKKLFVALQIHFQIQNPSLTNSAPLAMDLPSASHSSSSSSTSAVVCPTPAQGSASSHSASSTSSAAAALNSATMNIGSESKCANPVASASPSVTAAPATVPADAHKHPGAPTASSSSASAATATTTATSAAHASSSSSSSCSKSDRVVVRAVDAWPRYKGVFYVVSKGQMYNVHDEEDLAESLGMFKVEDEEDRQVLQLLRVFQRLCRNEDVLESDLPPVASSFFR